MDPFLETAKEDAHDTLLIFLKAKISKQMQNVNLYVYYDSIFMTEREGQLFPSLSAGMRGQCNHNGWRLEKGRDEGEGAEGGLDPSVPKPGVSGQHCPTQKSMVPK